MYDKKFNFSENKDLINNYHKYIKESRGKYG